MQDGLHAQGKEAPLFLGNSQKKMNKIGRFPLQLYSLQFVYDEAALEGLCGRPHVGLHRNNRERGEKTMILTAKFAVQSVFNHGVYEEFVLYCL